MGYQIQDCANSTGKRSRGRVSWDSIEESTQKLLLRAQKKNGNDECVKVKRSAFSGIFWAQRYPR